jgi:hypothetical protein
MELIKTFTSNIHAKAWMLLAPKDLIQLGWVRRKP